MLLYMVIYMIIDLFVIYRYIFYFGIGKNEVNIECN